MIGCIMKRTLLWLSPLLSLNSGWAASIIIGAPATGINAFPFGGEVGGAGTRYKQAYAAADFATVPISITSIDFLHGTRTLAPSTYTLYFSTITAGIDTLSNTDFDSNRGADNSFFVAVALAGPAPSTLTF